MSWSHPPHSSEHTPQTIHRLDHLFHHEFSQSSSTMKTHSSPALKHSLSLYLMKHIWGPNLQMKKHLRNKIIRKTYLRINIIIFIFAYYEYINIIINIHINFIILLFSVLRVVRFWIRPFIQLVLGYS
jgi:hypothetical protein